MWKRAGLALVSGLILSLAFEPLAVAYVAPPAIAGFVLSVRGLRARSALVPGLIFGAAFYFTHIEWMRTSVGFDAWTALATVETLFFGLTGVALAVVTRLPFWPVWGALAWTAVESLRSGWPFSGMPWGRLSYAVADTPFAQGLPYLGATVLSFLIALIGCLLAAVVVADGGRQRIVAGGAALGLTALGSAPALLPYADHFGTEAGTVSVAVVQGNVPGIGNDLLAEHEEVTANHVEATVDLADRVQRGETEQPDFVLWPENSTAVDPFDDGPVNDGVERAAAAVGVPVVVGAMVDAGPEHVLNQGIVWDPDTGAGDRYTKWHPVPYGEYIPFREYLGRSIGKLQMIPRDMLSGTRESPLRVGGVQVADAICFDIAYDDGIYTQVRNGAQILAVQTSNAMFVFTSQLDQQFAITRLRALETGRWLTVASTNGISGVIAPDGSVEARAPIRSTTVLQERVDLMEGLTPAVRMGAWPSRLFTGLTCVGLVLGMLAYRRKADSSNRSGRARPDRDGSAREGESLRGERQPA